MARCIYWSAAFLLIATVGHAGASRVVGLAIVTGDGPQVGVIDPFTVLAVKGSGKFTINAVAIDDKNATSAIAALHYAKAVARNFGFTSDFSKYDIHIEYEDKHTGHLGGSGGAAQALGIVAAMADLPVRQDVAITGDVSQVGVVSAVGGIPLKIAGAVSAGARTIIVPFENAMDVPQLPEQVLVSCQIILASNMSQVLLHGFGARMPGSGYPVYWQQRAGALGHFQQKEWKEAVTALSDYVQRFPDDLSCQRLLPIAEALFIHQKSASAWSAKAVDAEKNADPLLGMECYAKAIAETRLARLPTDALQPATDRCYEKAKETVMKLADGDNFLAVTRSCLILQQARQDDPDIVGVYRNAYAKYIRSCQEKTRSCLAKGDTVGARQVVEPELRLQPDDDRLRNLLQEIREAEATQHYNEGCELLNNNKFHDARKEFEAALELTLDKERIREKLSIVVDRSTNRDTAAADKLYEQGKFAEALDAYTQLMAVALDKDQIRRRLRECDLMLNFAPLVQNAIESDLYDALIRDCQDDDKRLMAIRLLQGTVSPRASMVQLLLAAHMSQDEEERVSKASLRSRISFPSVIAAGEEDERLIRLCTTGNWSEAITSAAKSEQVTPLRCMLMSLDRLQGIPPAQSKPDDLMAAAQWAIAAACVGPSHAEALSFASVMCRLVDCVALADANLNAAKALAPNSVASIGATIFAHLISCTPSEELPDVCAQHAGELAEEPYGYPFYLQACVVSQIIKAGGATGTEAETLAKSLREATRNSALTRYCQTPSFDAAKIHLLREYVKHCIIVGGDHWATLPALRVPRSQAEILPLLRQYAETKMKN